MRLQQAERNLAKSMISSPVSGNVDARRISVGDYVSPGRPLFQLSTRDRLRARLPFPETLALVLRDGLPVRLSTPMAPGEVMARITDIQPEITPTNRAINVIVDLENPGDWAPGASVTGSVRVALHEDVVVIPVTSLVYRPAGTVVYVLEDGRARERPVVAGLRQSGVIEILKGLSAGEPVAVDGAGFLTDGAAVDLKGR